MCGLALIVLGAAGVLTYVLVLAHPQGLREGGLAPTVEGAAPPFPGPAAAALRGVEVAPARSGSGVQSHELPQRNEVQAPAAEEALPQPAVAAVLDEVAAVGSDVHRPAVNALAASAGSCE